MRLSRALLVACAAALMIVLVPSAAMAFTIYAPTSTEPTQNAYGLWYAGQQSCAGDGVQSCHAALVAQKTIHSEFVQNVAAKPDALVPAAASAFWPSAGFGGLSLLPSDMYLQCGDKFGLLEYVGPANSPRGSITPSDDLTLWDPMAFSQLTNDWDPAGAIVAKSYSQSCSGCHNLGVSRPSKTTYTLPSGATQSATTPSGFVGMSIQCEVCHGSGENPGAHAPGIPETVGGYQVLKAQVCGQCHLTGTTTQMNISNKAFGNPNGFTPDEKLSDYITVTTSTPTVAQFDAYVASLSTGSPLAKPKFLPNGANYSMKHSYYNEWSNNSVAVSTGGMHGHTDPLNNDVKASSDPKCLGCHSGLGFLQRIGAKTPMGSFIVTDAPTLAEATAQDPGISCQICHVGHATVTATGYDSLRTWGNGKTVECSDCHNWDFDVLGSATQTETIKGAEQVRPPANVRISHPEREMFTGGSEGGGMWGVSTTSKFMSGSVACKDCHMPRTYREGSAASDNGNTDFTRVSHRFHALKPGDAKRFNVRKGGESCLPECHKQTDPGSWTRDQFQGWIDQTQAQIDTASHDVTSTLGVAAQGLGLSSWTDFMAAQPNSGAAAAITSQEWTYLQRAAQNADFVIEDKSHGVHQPLYARDGLAVAKKWAAQFGATPELSAAPGLFAGSSGAQLVGTIVGPGGCPVPGAEVAIEETTDDGSTWTRVGTATLDGTDFSFRTDAVSGTRTFRATFTSEAGATYASDAVDVTTPVTEVRSTPACDGWVNGDVTIELAPSRDDCLTFISMQGATSLSPTLYNGPIVVSAEGVTTITYWSISSEGSEPIRTQVVRIDRTAPSATSNAKSIYTETATIALSASDVGAGVDSLAWSLDGSAWTTVAASSTSVGPVTTLGSHTVRMHSADALGTTSADASIVFSVKAKTSIVPGTASYVSLRRGKYLSCSATIKRADGSALSGVSAILQRSTNNKTWTKYATVTTPSTGKVSKSIRMSSAGTSYWRWYVPEGAKCLTASGRATKAVVK